MITFGKKSVELSTICLYKYEKEIMTIHTLIPSEKTKKRVMYKQKMSQEEYEQLKIQIDEQRKYPKLFFIINPFSGTKKGRQTMEEIESYLQCMGIEYTVEYTTHAGHEREIAETYDFSMYDVIVAGGGDGTLHSIVNGLIEQHKEEMKPISPLPCGSGNGVAYSLYNDSHPLTAMCHIVTGEITQIDGFILDHKDEGKRYYGILQFEFAYLSSIDFESECIRWMGSARFILWTLWYMIKLMCYKAVIKTKRTRYVNNGLCGCLCNECHHNHVDNQIDYTGDIAEQIISRHKDPNDPQANDDGWETLPYNSYCIYFFNNFVYGMPGIEFAHGAHRNDGLLDTWILPEERATRMRFFGFWLCAVMGLFVPRYIMGFDYFRSTALSIQLEEEMILGIDGERLPKGKRFDIYAAPGLYKTILSMN